MTTAVTDHDIWGEGPPLEDPALAEVVHGLCAEVARLGGDEAPRELPRDVTAAGALLEDAARWTVERLLAGDPAVGPALLVSLTAALGDVREAGVAWRGAAFAQVHAALGRLRGATSLEQLIALAPVELCKCGFDRAMVTRLEGSVGVPVAFHAVGAPDASEAVLRVGRATPLKLDHLTVETEMLRRRGPVLVADARTEPGVHPQMLEVTGTRGYVAAPVSVQGRVVAFLHADCLDSRRLVDEFDRDLLAMFADGLAYAWERSVLTQRLTALRQAVRRDHSAVLAIMDEFSEAELEVARIDRENHAVAHSAAAMFVTTDSRLESLLTRRELDVMKLMAVGETNAGIAMKLVVSEGTVKSHVKHILRKLRAKNRAEAVSRFIKLAQKEPHAGS